MISASKVVILFTACLFVSLFASSNASNAEGIAFLEENAKKPGVVTLPSGLQYKVLKAGSGLHHPLTDTPCSCHYHGTLIDGTTFDSSYDRGSPTTFAPNQVIKGWTEIMQLMVEGDVFEITVPSDLAYGERGSPPKIPGGSVLVFKIEIVEILGEKDGLPLAIKCNPNTGEMCNEEENAYITKIASWTDEKKATELDRLGKLLLSGQKNIKPDLVQWIHRRIKILEQVVDSGKDQEL